jgi:hypothetical protein
MSHGLFQTLAKLSERNPDPVFSVSREGLVLHANFACGKVLENWGVKKGTPCPADLKGLVESVFESGLPQKQNVATTKGLCDFEATPIIELDFNFVVVHGHASKNSQERRTKAIERLDAFLFSEKKNELLVKNALDGIITIDA